MGINEVKDACHARVGISEPLTQIIAAYVEHTRRKLVKIRAVIPSRYSSFSFSTETVS
jgi:hypothetical protein